MSNKQNVKEIKYYDYNIEYSEEDIKELDKLKDNLKEYKKVIKLANWMLGLQPFIATGIIIIALLNKEVFGIISLMVPFITTIYFLGVKVIYNKQIKKHEFAISLLSKLMNQTKTKNREENLGKINNLSLKKTSSRTTIKPKRMYNDDIENTLTRRLTKKKDNSK